jgi:hypothetical protein
MRLQSQEASNQQLTKVTSATVPNDFVERARFVATRGRNAYLVFGEGRTCRRHIDRTCGPLRNGSLSLEILAQLDVPVSTRADDAVIGIAGREVDFQLADFYV